MFLLVFYFTLAITVSFLCSLLESMILSVPYSYVQSSLNAGLSHANLLKKLKHQINRPLSAILTVNTIANTVGALGVGAQVQQIYGNKYIAFVSVLLTLMILIFSEIIPKTLGATYWRFLIPFGVYVMQALVVVCYPFVKLSHYFQLFLGGRVSSIAREDLVGAAEVAVAEGVIYRNESELIKNILKLKSQTVSEIMTPRTVITAFEMNVTVEEVIEKYQPLRFARIPVYESQLDQVIGIVHRYKILEAGSRDGELKSSVKNYLKPVHSIPETISLSAVFDQFIKRKEHIFIVVDEYGTVSGLVSMEDVVETILGIEIVDELDTVADMREQARLQWEQKKRQSKKINNL